MSLQCKRNICCQVLCGVLFLSFLMPMPSVFGTQLGDTGKKGAALHSQNGSFPKYDKDRSVTIKPLQAATAVSLLKAGTTNSNTLGCILPLTGRVAPYGNRTLDMIMIIFAAGLFDNGDKTYVNFIIEDSQSRPELAAEAVGNRLMKAWSP